MTDTGTGYDTRPSTYVARLTEVGRGTPMGELLRRYWHPVGLAADAGATPRPVKILGEELILFRDGQGRAGLVYPRCCHRGPQPWYPVEKRYGLVFAYLGPLEKKPVLPRYECLEVMGPGEFVEADD